MKQVRCPIVAAIEDVRVGGLYDSDEEEYVVATGGDDSVDVIYAEANYRLTLTKLEFARFEVSPPIFPLAIKWVDEHYGWMYGKSYTDIYHEIIDKTIKSVIIGDQLQKIMSAIDALEKYCVEVIGKKRAFDVSFSAFPWESYDASQLVRYPKYLRALNTAIINYCKKFSISGVAKCPFVDGLQPPEIPPETEQFPAQKKAQKKKNPQSTEDVLLLARELAKCEEEIMLFVSKIEKYQRVVIDSHAACLSMLLSVGKSLLDRGN